MKKHSRDIKLGQGCAEIDINFEENNSLLTCLSDSALWVVMIDFNISCQYGNMLNFAKHETYIL